MWSFELWNSILIAFKGDLDITKCFGDVGIEQEKKIRFVSIMIKMELESSWQPVFVLHLHTVLGKISKFGFLCKALLTRFQTYTFHNNNNQQKTQ